MAQAHTTAGRTRLQLRRQVIDPAGGFRDGELAVVDRDDAAAVVSAVLQPPQSLDQEIDCLARTDVTDDATHKLRSWFARKRLPS
jgi:hypothetical protein